MECDGKLPEKETFWKKVKGFWKKVKGWWEYNGVNEILFTIFTLSLPVIAGYIIAINLPTIHQVTISMLIILLLFIIHINWGADVGILSFVFVLILIGIIIGDIIYYFVWYDGSINWLSIFVPN